MRLIRQPFPWKNFMGRGRGWLRRIAYYEGESINKVNLSTASTQPFWQLTVSDNIANFIRKLGVLHVQTCSNAILSSWVHNGYMSVKNVNSPYLLTLPPISEFGKRDRGKPWIASISQNTVRWPKCKPDKDQPAHDSYWFVILVIP
jgi:hypothetical protein